MSKVEKIHNFINESKSLLMCLSIGMDVETFPLE